MTSVQREYILKGVFLGLWAYLALLLPGWDSFGRVVAWTGGGLVLGLIAGAVLQVMRGYKPQANPGGFLLLTLLDSSFVIYIGVVGGLAVGLLTERPPELSADVVEAITGAAATAPAYPIRDWLGY